MQERSASFNLRLSCFWLCAGMIAAGCPETPQMPTAHGELWLQFAHITDTHILDDESPARTVGFADLSAFAWRPHEAYTAQVLDATLQVLNAHHTGHLQPAYPLDFVLHTGDAVDNAQYNELRWFMEVMDGEVVTPDSGVLDGPERACAVEDNPKLPFQAAGLLPEIPWYMAHGNHDALSIGIFHIDTSAADAVEWTAPLLFPVAAVLGLHRFGMNAFSPTASNSAAIILGSMDVADPTTMELRWDLLEPGAMPLDINRHYIDGDRFIAEHFNSTTAPLGHGFVPGGPLYYAVRPRADVPIRLVVLDTTAPSPADGIPVSHGVMTRDQFEHFLKPQFAAARAAGEWVLVASHHPSIDFDLFYSFHTVGTGEFRRFLASQSNMIAHLCGHTHLHQFQMIAGTYPYAEIVTASLIDYPQEARIISLYYIAETQQFRVESHLVSHMEAPTRLSAESYRRAVFASEKEAETGAFVKRYGVLPADLFPAGALAGTSLEANTVARKADSRGGDGDRDFSIVLPRGRMAR